MTPYKIEPVFLEGAFQARADRTALTLYLASEVNNALAEARREVWEDAARLCANAVRLESDTSPTSHAYDQGYNRACQELESLLTDRARKESV